jgi:hypothetical protein
MIVSVLNEFPTKTADLFLYLSLVFCHDSYGKVKKIRQLRLLIFVIIVETAELVCPDHNNKI